VWPEAYFTILNRLDSRNSSLTSATDRRTEGQTDIIVAYATAFHYVARAKSTDRN